MTGTARVASPGILMHAAVMTAPGRTELRRLPRPEPAPGEVRVRLEGSGVCGSNLPVWEGRPWFRYPLDPGAPGHEGWGQVDALGDGVSGLAVGDRVVTLSARAFAEYVLAPAAEVVPLPPALGAELFPGEPLGCAMNVFHRAAIRRGQTVAVLGVGFLGAVLVRLAAQAGARVVAASRRPWALELARRLGAEVAMPLGHPGKVHGAVREVSNRLGADVVIEAIGQQGPLDLAAELARVRGRVVIAGYHQDGARQVNLQLWNWHGLDIINAHERDPAVYAAGVRAAISAVASGAIPLSQLLTHLYPLARLGDAMEAMRTRPEGFLKAVVLT